MKRYRFPTSLYLAIIGLFVGLMLIELAAVTVASPFDQAGAHRVVSSLSRSHNVMVSVILVSIALAIPITATQYSPKLLRLFLTDRLHLAVLTTYTMVAVHANYVLYLSRGSAVPEGLVLSVFLSSALGFALVVPYFFYVIFFLEPQTLIRRINRLLLEAAHKAMRHGEHVAPSRNIVADSIHNLGSLILKSIDGHGRQTAAQGLNAYREALAAYGELKTQMPDEWFHTTKQEFRGLSREALQFISADRCWVEIAALQDLSLVYEAALKRMPDAVISVADTLRGIAIDALEREDAPVVENAVRTFNAMIRSAIVQGEPHAVFDVLTQYRALAEECLEKAPGVSVEITNHMGLYSRRAQQANLVFIPELFLYDAGSVLRVAVETEHPSVEGVFEACLGLLEHLAKTPSVPLACAGLVTLGWILEDFDENRRKRFIDGIDKIPRGIVEAGLGVLDSTVSPRYHELTARQIDLNFMPPHYVEALRSLFNERWAKNAS